jgi:hypothetical protein
LVVARKVEKAGWFAAGAFDVRTTTQYAFLTGPPARVAHRYVTDSPAVSGTCTDSGSVVAVVSTASFSEEIVVPAHVSAVVQIVPRTVAAA